MFLYDVFLSFRGLDTRDNFTSHLYNALKRNSFQVFHDTSLPRGQSIAPHLLEAIENSQIFLVVFSNRYADSRWCLDELAHMTHCMCHTNYQQTLVPVFLDVKQSDIHVPFEQLVTKCEMTFDQETVHKWRQALYKAGELPALSLHDHANGDENELLEQIVEKIRKMLHGLQQADLNVGIDSRVNEVISLLNMGSDDVRVVVIRGPAGIGKTTIAKAAYERLALQFKARYCCFLSDVKTIFGETNGKLTLQKKLVSNLSQDDESQRHIGNYHEGIRKIEKMIRNQRLLLVLDDVDHDEQLKVLGMSREILGRGSGIIVTTRDESNIVDWIKPDDAKYEPRLLDDNESLEVFCLDAFEQTHLKEGYEDVSRKAVCWGAGCPGVLKDLALYMRHYQSIEEWEWGLSYVMQNPSYLTDGSSL